MGFIKNIIGSLYKSFYADEIAQNQAEIDGLKKEILQLQGPKEQKIPTSYGIITWQEELTVLKPLGAPVNLTDNYLQLTTIEEAKVFSDESRIQYNKWVVEAYDCDNFSASLYGYWSDSLKSFAFGMARSATHQFNIMIDKDKNVWIVEPQTNTFYTVDEAKKASNASLSYWPITYIWM